MHRVAKRQLRECPREMLLMPANPVLISYQTKYVGGSTMSPFVYLSIIFHPARRRHILLFCMFQYAVDSFVSASYAFGFPTC